nr:short-chain dehydrogenase TIC 32, chloroplastic-like [Tanacetum cinerariifolium]
MYPSGSHRFMRKSSGIFYDQINDESSYNHVYAYGWSKLANLPHANAVASLFNGAARTCNIASNPKVKDVMGKYFSDSNLEPSTIAKDQDLAKETFLESMQNP